MLQSSIDECHKKMIEVVITQINLLICLFNDMIDYNLIESGQFTGHSEIFDPTKSFKFIVNMFKSQAKI